MGEHAVHRAPLILVAVVAAVAAGCGGSSEGKAAKPPTRQAFVSRPDLRPPVVTIAKRTDAAADGYVFLAPKEKRDPGGPLILDGRGRVVWFDSIEPQEATDFRVQSLRGRPVLTWWQGTITKTGVGDGVYVIVDETYRPVARLRAGHGIPGDLHEFLLTDRGTALVTAYAPVRADLSPVGGPRAGWAYDSVVQELAVPSGRVLFEWRSLDHVPVTESASRQPAKRASRKAPFDYFHVNSIDVDTDGNLIVSARNTHAAYKIDRRSGAVIWRLGGTKSDFRMAPGTRFAYQHDVRRQGDGTITVFDNGATPPVHKHTRLLTLRVDETKKTATLVHAFTHPDGRLIPFEGNVQRLPNGDSFVGWGGKPFFSELSPSGRLVLDGGFGIGDSYRAYRLPWSGRPATKPAVVVRDGTAYVSWNGATEVAKWEVTAGGRVVATAAKDGFETAIPIDTDADSVRVRALDAAGKLLATSSAAATSD